MPVNSLTIYGLVFLTRLLQRFLLVYAPHNFTLGESGLIASLVSYYVMDSCSDTATGEQSGDTVLLYHLKQALFWGMVASGTLTAPLLIYIRKCYFRKDQQKMHRLASALFFFTFALIIIWGVRPWWMSIISRKTSSSAPDPFYFTISFVFKRTEHWYLFFWWCLSLVMMSTIIRYRYRLLSSVQQYLGQQKQGFTLDLQRKFFHFTSVLIFLPGILFSVCYLLLHHI